MLPPITIDPGEYCFLTIRKYDRAYCDCLFADAGLRVIDFIATDRHNPTDRVLYYGVLERLV